MINDRVLGVGRREEGGEKDKVVWGSNAETYVLMYPRNF